MAAPPRRAAHEIVVRHTFIEVLDAATDVAPLGMAGRRRVCSDSALFETSEKEMKRLAGGPAEGGGDVEFELRGLSDADTDPEDDGPGRLPCYDHIRSRQVSQTVDEAPAASSAACAAAPPGGELPLEVSAGEPLPSGHLSQALDCESLHRLLSENERLQLENRLLRESASRAQQRGAAEPESDGQAAPPSVKPPHVYAVPQVQPVCAGGWWVCAAPTTPPLGPGCDPQDMPTPMLLGREHYDYAAMGHFEASDQCPPLDTPVDKRTTVMMRNLPNNYSRSMVLAMLNENGFGGLYDFIYLPIDFKSRACLGYAFVNLVSPQVVGAFWRKFDGFAQWALPSKKVCSVSWSGPYQGLQAHIARYRNSPVMHSSVPEAYKPAVFVDGVQVAFPPPTKSPRAPRMRRGTRVFAG